MFNKEKFEAGLTFTLKGESINTLHKLNKSHGSNADDWFISGKHRYMEESEWTHECNVNIKVHVIECFAVFMNTLARSVIRYEHLIFEEPVQEKYTIEDSAGFITAPPVTKKYDSITIIREHDEKNKT